MARHPIWTTLWLITALIMTIAPIGTAVAEESRYPLPQSLPPGPVTDSLTITGPASTVLDPGEESSISIPVSGQDNENCRGIPDRPVDVLIVLDVSSSAGTGPGSNWEHTLTLARSLIDYLSRPVYRSAEGKAEYSWAGLVTSKQVVTGTIPTLLQPLTGDYELLKKQLAGLSSAGDTDVGAGVRLATDELSRLENEQAKAVLLMLHDNTALDENTVAAIAEVNHEDIPVYLIANSLNIPEEKRITEDTASEIMPGDRIYIDPDNLALYDLALNMMEGNKDRAAADVRVSESFSPPGLVQLSAVKGPGGSISADRVMWQISELDAGEEIELSHEVRVLPTAGGGVNIAINAMWLDCNGYPQNTTTETTIEIQPTPTATEAPTPEEQPTSEPERAETPIPLSPTRTPEGGIVIPPIPTTPHPGPSILTPLLTLFPGIPSWLWWILLALLALALAVFLWWLLRRLWSGGGRPKPSPGPPRKRPEPPPKRSEGVDIVDERRRGPLGRDVLAEWRTPVKVTGPSGKEWTVWIRPSAERVEQVLGTGKNIRLVVRLDESEREIGRIETTLRWQKEFDHITGEEKRWRQMRVDRFEVDQRQAASGVEEALLKQVEHLARSHRTHEIYGTLKNGKTRPYFEMYGYETHSENNGEYTVTKRLDTAQ